MGKQYDTEMLKTLSALQKDLSASKINKEEFEFLLGLLLQNEVDNFVQHKINKYITEDNEDCISIWNRHIAYS